MNIPHKLLSIVLVIGLVPTTALYIFYTLPLVVALFWTAFHPSFLFYFLGGFFGLLSTWVMVIKYGRNNLGKKISNIWVVGNVVTLLVSIYYFSQFVVGLSPTGIAFSVLRPYSSYVFHAVISLFPLATSLYVAYVVSKAKDKALSEVKSSYGGWSSFKISIAILSISILYIFISRVLELNALKEIHAKANRADYDYVETSGISRIKSVRFINERNIVIVSNKNTINVVSLDNDVIKVVSTQGCATDILAISDDGTKTASISEDNHSIVICNALTGEVLSILSVSCKKYLDCKVDSALFSGDGLKLATISGRKVKLWVLEQNIAISLDGHCQNEDVLCDVTSANFSPDSKLLATTSDDDTAKLWSVDSGELIAELKGHCEQKQYCGVKKSTFSKDGLMLVTSSNDNTARVWDVVTGKQLSVLVGHEDDVWSARFSSDGAHVVTAGWDNTVRVWNSKTGKQLTQIDGGDCDSPMPSSCDMMDARFSNDDSKILTLSRSNPPRIWDARNGELLSTLGGYSSAPSFASYSPDERHVITASWSSVRIWDISNGHL